MGYQLQPADGVARWINGLDECVGPDDGTGPKLFSVWMDVTARKQAEASAARKGQNWSTSPASPPSASSPPP